jgi:outer membrane protein assembly factor BamB
LATDTDQALMMTATSDRLYVYEADPNVWAIDRSTGKLLWTVPFDDHIRTLRVDGDAIEVTQDEAEVTLDAAGRVTAEKVVEAPEEEARPEAPFIAGDWTYTRTPEREYHEGILRARNRKTGASWRFATDRVLAVRDGTAYTCGDGGILHAIDVASGKASWWADTGPGCPVTVAGGRVYSAVEGKLLAFDPDQPSLSKDTVTIRGSFDGEAGGLRVWVGDKMVKTDRKGRFKAKVKRRSVVTVALDPRDVEGNTDPVAVFAGKGDIEPVVLTEWYEDCH